MIEDAKSDSALLAADALKGVRVAVSASESPDLDRLGLVETHFRLALAEIARSVLVSGGKLSYGGDLNPSGYTALLIHELQRYSRRDKPLEICLAWQEHRKLSRDDFELQKSELGLFGEIVCLDPDGKPVRWESGRGDAAELVTDGNLIQRSLTALRRYMVTQTNGRVLIGGKRTDFQGHIPGVLEEAIISIEADQPLYLAGGFGGITADVIRALGIDDGTWLPHLADAPAADERIVSGLTHLSQIAKSKGPSGIPNGLTANEIRRLSVTYRPSEIAALVSLGLGRRFAKTG